MPPRRHPARRSNSILRYLFIGFVIFLIFAYLFLHSQHWKKRLSSKDNDAQQREDGEREDRRREAPEEGGKNDNEGGGSEEASSSVEAHKPRIRQLNPKVKKRRMYSQKDPTPGDQENQPKEGDDRSAVEGEKEPKQEPTKNVNNNKNVLVMPDKNTEKPIEDAKESSEEKADEKLDINKVGEYDPNRRGGLAYLSIISNEKYVDGAMAFVYMLRRNSKALQEKRCESVLLIPDEISMASRHRLHSAGWDRLMLVDDLSHFALKSTWKNTFNKLYMFGLSEYDKIAYYDVDVLPLHNPDLVFNTSLPDGDHVGAIGTPGDTYFKTGMIILQPSKQLFEGLMKPLREGKYNHGSGRDGSLLRDYFNGRFKAVTPVYSQYRRPWQDLNTCIVFHFRGAMKPWMDPSNLPPMKAENIDFGPAYRIWWEEYLRMHYDLYVNTSNGFYHHDKKEWGGKHAGPGITPETHMWLLRLTADEWIVPIWDPFSSTHNFDWTSAYTAGDKTYTCDTWCRDRQHDCAQRKKAAEKAKKSFEEVCEGSCNKWLCHPFCHFAPADPRPETAECGTVCPVGKDAEAKDAKLVHCADRWPYVNPHKKK